MEITIDLMQLLLALLILVGVALGVFLIILLARLIGTLKRVSHLIDEIHEPVAAAVELLPGVLSNVDAITKDVTVLTESINQTVPAMLKDAQTMTGTAREGVEAVGHAAKTVGEGFNSFFRPVASAARADYLGSIINIVSKVAGVIGYFARRKKDGAKERQKARGRKR